MANRIPPDLETAIFAKAGEGLSTRAIAAWLLSQHGVTTSHVSVSRMLAKRRTERADVAKVVIREQLGKSLATDLDRLEEIRADLARRAAECDDESTMAFVRLTELEVRVLDRKLHYSGADSPDEDAPRSGIPLDALPEAALAALDAAARKSKP